MLWLWVLMLVMLVHPIFDNDTAKRGEPMTWSASWQGFQMIGKWFIRIEGRTFVKQSATCKSLGIRFEGFEISTGVLTWVCS